MDPNTNHAPVTGGAANEHQGQSFGRGGQHHIPVGGGKKRLSKKMLLSLAGLVVLGLALWHLFNFLGLGSSVNKNEYQAVFLSNGQVYFGKLKDMSGDQWQLDDVYYLQQTQQQNDDKSTNGQQNLQQQTQPQLIRLGQEIHKPHGTMYLKSDQVLFWENIQNDGKVANAINDAKKAQ